MNEQNPCIGLPLEVFTTALSWYRTSHPEIKVAADVDWEQVRDIGDDILGKKLRKREKGKPTSG